MTRQRSPHRRDSNHAEIVKALRAFGVGVLDISSVGGGAPDLVTWPFGFVPFAEIKVVGDSPRPNQFHWWMLNCGTPPVVLSTVDDCLAHHQRLMTWAARNREREP